MCFAVLLYGHKNLYCPRRRLNRKYSTVENELSNALEASAATKIKWSSTSMTEGCDSSLYARFKSAPKSTR